ncbi:hypothetical protein ACC684_39565, partial [Rhizobium ruizarguesonis]
MGELREGAGVVEGVGGKEAGVAGGRGEKRAGKVHGGNGRRSTVPKEQKKMSVNGDSGKPCKDIVR